MAAWFYAQINDAMHCTSNTPETGSKKIINNTRKTKFNYLN